jgi:Zn-dependent protease with chaperone function
MRLARISLVAVVVVTACAPVSKLPTIDEKAAEAEAEKQRELILETIFAQHGRVHDIAYALFQRNAGLCKDDTAHSIGVTVANKFSMGPDYEGTLGRVYGFGETANLSSVAEGSPASTAGLAVGAALVSINGWSVPTGKEAPQKVRAKLAEFTEDDPNLRLVVDTKGGRRQVDVTARRVCDYKFGVMQQDDVNAFADGESIAVTSGMIRFADSDRELATVLGHEMAHNLMGHHDKKTGNWALGLLVDILFAGAGVNTQGTFSKLAARMYSKEFEAEADYVGLYLMARAGFAIEETPNFWRRMAIAHPGSVKRGLAASHPPTPERFLALEKTVEEINAKRAGSEALLPETGFQQTRKPRPESRSPFGR